MNVICGDKGMGGRCTAGVTACTGGAVAGAATFVALTVLSLLCSAWVISWFLTASISSAALSNVVWIVLGCAVFVGAGLAVAAIGSSVACGCDNC